MTKPVWIFSHKSRMKVSKCFSVFFFCSFLSFIFSMPVANINTHKYTKWRPGFWKGLIHIRTRWDFFSLCFRSAEYIFCMCVSIYVYLCIHVKCNSFFGLLNYTIKYLTSIDTKGSCPISFCLLLFFSVGFITTALE